MHRRNTSQRQIVYDALVTLGHASVESLIEYLRVHHEQISLATIYRNISILLEDGKIRKVKLRNEDVLETVKENHAHFVCEKCGMILDMMDQYRQFNSYHQKNMMHQIKYSDIAFYGICQNCKQEEEIKNEVRM